MSAQTVAEQMPQNLDRQTRQTEGKTTWPPARIAGKTEAAHSRVLLKQLPINGALQIAEKDSKDENRS